ncbi:hypothetical protein [Chryseosolibacter indicus]|uniref:Uncharacterized protein n=1 Tax=Chryseosolibacter indicus TaxID=2782351 RepID=A0ABS5VN38_9BACT|nr:hypothetical protein [Chryseosolibacter indicus]MBT1702872.1 hypothetical protein [Chryseosolibacter indicus]
MKKLVLIIFSLTGVLIPDTGFSQHNLFDVPTTEIVEYKKLFFQQQAVFTKEEINAATTFTYGLGYNFEVGLTIHQLDFKRSQGIEVDPDNHPDENPDFLINMQKAFIITNDFQIGIGTRSGINAAKHNNEIKFVNFDYINGALDISDGDYVFVAGAYYANKQYAGEGTNWGAMAGIDLALLKNKMYFIGEVITGNSSLSVFNTGLEFTLPKNWKIEIGIQLPVPGSDNDRGGIIQISKN